MKEEVQVEEGSVIYRGKRWGRITSADYDEAIAALQDAKEQLEPNGNSCHVCGDSGHCAWECHHNPLAVARSAASWLGQGLGLSIVDPPTFIPWKCFHCGRVFLDAEDAAEHFGATDTTPSKCQELLLLLAGCVDPDKNEATGYPFWFIASPGRNGRQNIEAGLWFSREDATGHLEAKHYNYPKSAFVYCASGNNSPKWRQLLDGVRKMAGRAS